MSAGHILTTVKRHRIILLTILSQLKFKLFDSLFLLIRANTHLVEQLDPASLDNINTPDDLASSVLEKAI